MKQNISQYFRGSASKVREQDEQNKNLFSDFEPKIAEAPTKDLLHD